MAKSFKKISVILFVVLLTALLIVGCALLANTGKISQSENLENTEDIQAVADKKYSLTGSTSNMTSIWTQAVQYSVTNKVEVFVTLDTNWTAPNSSTSGFGSGTGYSTGALHVPAGAKITLNLNGKKLNRNLASSSTGVAGGRCFSVEGTLTITDTSFKHSLLYSLNSVSAINNANIGRITGANVSDGTDGSAIAVVGASAVLNLYGGVLYNNTHQSKGNASAAIYAGGGGVVNMYDGLIAYNTTKYYASAIAVQNSGILNMYGGIVRNNTGGKAAISFYESTFDDANSKITIGAGVQIYNNTNSSSVRANLRLAVGKKLYFFENLGNANYGSTFVGITLESGYSSAFTANYSSVAAGTPANRFLFSDESNKKVQNTTGEASIQSGSERTSNVTWRVNGSNISSTHYGVDYTGSNYTITCSGGNIFQVGNASSAASFSVSAPGHYAFVFANSSYLNQTFSFTIGEPNKIVKPSGTIASKVYTGSTITCANPTGFDSSKMSITGNTGINVAAYTAKVALKDARNYWSDGTANEVQFTWQITRKPVAKPTAGTNILPYTGKVVTYTPDGYSSSQMTISGNTGTAPNEYTATISPNSNHQWSDGTTTAVTIKWRIGTPIAKPTVGTNSFVYNGSSQTYTPASFNSATMDITGNTGINANTYTASISPKTGYCWNDNTVGAFTLTWSITRKPIDRPTAGTNSFVYNGSSQTYQGSGYNSSTMVLGGTSSATNAGTYNITIAPNSNHQWNIGTATETISFPWSITPKPLAKPTLSMTKLEYNSKTLTVPTVGYDSNTMYITGNTGIDAGKKVATITLKDPSNYKWADNTTGSVSLNWEILKKPLEKPTEAVQKTFIYDGTEKTYTPNKIVADGMLLTDNKATEVGTYYAKVNLKPNYQWVGNTEEELSFRFMIVPPGLVVKEGVDYDFIYTDNGTWNQRYTYGDSYQHKMNDQELNQVGGDNVYILGKVQPNTTIAQFLDNIDSDRDFIKIYNNFGELVYDGTANEVASPVQYIGTSYKVELYVTGESGLEILDEVYISILGDLNADGIVNSADMAMMRRLLNGDINLYSLPLERVLAVYLDNKGGLTSVDQELLNGLVAGRITSNELFEEQELLGEEESYKYIDLVDGRRVQASTESAVIGNVTAGTSISEFVDKVAVFFNVGGASNITLYNNVGELVYNGIEGIQTGHSMQEYVGTGWKVQASNSETQYTVSVLGDVTGDGIINAMDVTYLRRIANDNKLLAELEASGNKAVLLAATISNRGGICTADSEILWGTICGTMDLSRYN